MRYKKVAESNEFVYYPSCSAVLRKQGRVLVNLPQIELSELPDLEKPAGIFGSIDNARMDDSIIILMAYVFEIDPPAD